MPEHDAPDSRTPTPRFRWPPGPSVTPDAAPPATFPSRSTTPELADGVTGQPRAEPWWSHVERAWLGRTAASWPERARSTDWHADGPGDYCPRCGRTVGVHELRDLDDDPTFPPGCSSCARTRPPWSRVVRLGEYNGVLREAILDVKLTAWRRLGSDLGKELARAIASECTRARVAPGSMLVVPVPTATWRRLARGIDHTLVLARSVAASLDAPLVQALRRSHRPSQTRVAAGQRWENVRGTMRSRRPLPPDVGLVLIDDVMTTGATMSEACRAVRAMAKASQIPAPGLIWAGVLGVTPERAQGASGA